MNKEELMNIMGLSEKELEKIFGVQHYKMKFDNGIELDVVDYEKYKKIEEENKQLKDNWNKLKSWIKSNDEHYPNAIPFRQTLRVMQELEKGEDNEQRRNRR